MDYEFKDYRKPPKIFLGSWPFWIVPNFWVFDYIVKLVIFLVVIPMFFGVVLTSIGIFLNFLLVDFLVYKQYSNNLDRNQHD